MLEYSDAMTIYRTYPHLDMAVTGARACDLLEQRLSGLSLHKAMRKIPFLFPLTSQCTSFDPCKAIYDGLDGLGVAEGMSSVDFATGFPPADIAECGAAVVAYGEDADAAEAAAERIYQQVLGAEAFHLLIDHRCQGDATSGQRIRHGKTGQRSRHGSQGPLHVHRSPAENLPILNLSGEADSRVVFIERNRIRVST